MAAGVNKVSLFSLAVSHGGGGGGGRKERLRAGKSAQEKAERGGDAEVKLELLGLINCLQSQLSLLRVLL